MKLKIDIDGNNYEVTPKPGDLVRLERAYDISASSLGEGMKVEHVLFLAWTALHRAGTYTEDFETFLDVADVEEDDARPLDEA